MTYAGKISLIVVASGITLGALLGDAADPEPKQPPEQWWQLTGNSSAFTASAPEPRRESMWPEHVSFPDSYRPDLDYDATITSYWEPPDWDWYGDDDPPELGLAERTAADSLWPDPVEDAADAAVEVADEAAAAEAAPPAADPVVARKAPLTSEGLY